MFCFQVLLIEYRWKMGSDDKKQAIDMDIYIYHLLLTFVLFHSRFYYGILMEMGGSDENGP
jgi:hypothetical protein